MPGQEPFEGVIGPTADESTPWWPAAPDLTGKPNVVLILFDDTGFAHFGCFGSDIDTPNIDRLAAGGLRYTNYHTTALCSPTRAALLTGRNHHTVGMRSISNFDTGYPNMRGRISHNAATVAELLGDAGYATHAIGKWHLCPMVEASTAGPFDDWPLGRGFDRFYGFMQGETDQFHPELTYDNHHIDSPTNADGSYHVSEDLTDKAIEFIRESKSVRPDKPFFSYIGWGATHSPHQAPQAYLDKYRGRYEEGWDVIRQRYFDKQLELGVIPEGTELAPRNKGVKAWAEMSASEQALAARLQEAFAAFLDHTDAQIGRIVDYLESIDELDNTVFIVTSDNGASQEGFSTGVVDEMRFFNGFPEDVEAAQDRLDDIGGPNSHSNYPWGWAQVGNTPLKWYKQNTFGGGVRDPLVIHWPAGISDAGAVRTQFQHVVDLTPTILELAGVEQPDTFRGREQLPVAGRSLRYSFDAPDAPSNRDAQYFEMFGHRGIWSNGWKAVTWHRSGGTPFDEDTWELYKVDEDFSECNNLAEQHPEKLAELTALWWEQAAEHGVLPLDDSIYGLFFRDQREGTPHSGTSYRLLPPLSRLPSEAAPAIASRSWTMTATIDRPTGDENGVLVAYGTANTGFTWFVNEGEIVFDYNLFGTHHVARAAAPAGAAAPRVIFERNEDGAAITVEGADGTTASVQVPYVLRMIGMSGMDVGRDTGSPVSTEYAGPFPFTGIFQQLDVEITDDLSPEEIFALNKQRVRNELTQQ